MSCPVTGDDASDAVAYLDYNGARYGMCCTSCTGDFLKHAPEVLKAEFLKNRVTGAFLFDPVSGARIEPKNAKATSDFGGTRFYFSDKTEKTTFDATPKKFATQPSKESFYCPVMRTELKDYLSAAAYYDYSGVRYYLCCADCLDAMKSGAKQFVANSASHLHAPAAILVWKK